MKPLKLKARGFIGIWNGQGLDEICIDLSSIDGLIAFDGKNGSGKTTCMDLMTPFRQLASRGGSLAHHVRLRDSFKDFTFHHDGHTYQTLVKIDCQSGKQEGFIWKDDEPQVSGKVTEYDKYIENLLGSPKLFFQSVFAAQGGDSMADMTTGELKSLFSEFLRLDKLAEWEETAKLAGNAIESQIEAIRQRIGINEAWAEKIGQLRADKTNCLFKLDTVTGRVKELEQEMSGLLVDIDKDKAAITAHNAAVEKKADLEKQAEKAAQELRTLNEKLSGMVDKHNKEKAEIQAKIDRLADDLNAEHLEKQLKDEQARTEKRIPDLENRVDKIESDIEATNALITTNTERAQKLNKIILSETEEANKHLQKMTADLSDARARLKDEQQKEKDLANDRKAETMAQQIEVMKSTAGKLDQRDPDCKSTTCIFIKDALDAQTALPEVEAEYRQYMHGLNNRKMEQIGRIMEAEDHISQYEKAEEEARAAVADVTNKHQVEKSELETEFTTLTNDMTGHREKLVELRAEIKTARERLATIKHELSAMPDVAAAKAEHTALKEKLDSAEEAFSERRDELTQQVKEKTNAEQAIRNKEKELSLDWQAVDRLETKTSKLEDLKRRSQQVASEREELKSRIAVIDHQITETEKTGEKVKADQESIAALQKELSDYRYIQQACGANGLRALEIDGTAPLIAGFANELLTDSFGPMATVGFRTLTDEGKECLDVVVYRDDDQDENGTLLDNLSGGQKVWILKALRLALTLVSKQKSGKNFTAALSDEEDGALDEENAIAFINLYRAFMASGGFDTCLYITHRDACKAMADHVIRLTGNGIEIDSVEGVRAA
jgi:DNA repair exonuclease SbcCD ATPase subunit